MCQRGSLASFHVKDVHVALTGNPKLPVGVCVSVSVCVRINAQSSLELFQRVPRLGHTPVTLNTGNAMTEK